MELPAYDQETGSQPLSVFLCHQQDGRVCAGWCGTHDMAESLAVRFAEFSNSDETIAAILDYTTETPLFSSGREACDHGMRDIKNPDHRAVRSANSLLRKRKARGCATPQTETHGPRSGNAE